MTVYRVQNEHGRGPYSATVEWPGERRISRSWFERNLDRHNALNRPEYDPGIREFLVPHFSAVIDLFRCGADSLEQLRMWFYRYDALELDEKGFHLVEIEAATVLKGSHQVLFRVDHSRVVKTLPLRSLYESS